MTKRSRQRREARRKELLRTQDHSQFRAESEFRMQVLDEAFALLQSDYAEQWRRSAPEEKRKRDALWNATWALRAVRFALARMLRYDGGTPPRWGFRPPRPEMGVIHKAVH